MNKYSIKDMLTLLVGFFLLIRGTMRIIDGQIPEMGALMALVGLVGIVLFFIRKYKKRT